MNIYKMCSRDNLVTLRASHRSRCGAVLILKSLAQASQHSVRIGSLSLWRGANFDMARTNPLGTLETDRSRCGEVLIFRTQEILDRDLAKSAPMDILPGDLAKRPLVGRLY